MGMKIKSLAPAYELTIRKVTDGENAIGILRSDLLDRTLHPKATADVAVSGKQMGPKGQFELSGFVAASLADYVSSQQSIKVALEDAFRSGRAGPRGIDASMKGNVWSGARIREVAFEEKQVMDEKRLKAWKAFMPKMNLARLRKNSDRPSTRSRFTIQILVDWDREHDQVLATFRDGILAGVSQ